MKFTYVDESGDRSQGEVFVMGGLMVDAYKLRKKTADVYERLKSLSNQHEGEKFELKTKKFIEGRGGWKSISRLERQNLLSGLIHDALHGGSEVFAIGLTFEAFDNANNSKHGQAVRERLLGWGSNVHKRARSKTKSKAIWQQRKYRVYCRRK